MVYSQRLVARDKQPWHAAWHRAYAFALAGLHRLALDDLQTAATQWQAAKEGGPQPLWVVLLDAYCRFDHARLKAAGQAGPEKNLALLLWFDSVDHSYHKASILAAALETLEKFPECYAATDALCQFGGVSVGHMASSAPLVIAGKTLYPRVLAAAGLPQAAIKIAEVARENADADDDDTPVKEFQLRAKLIRVLLESDGSVPSKMAEAAPVKMPPAALDRGEPTWVCLGRMIGELSFLHAWRRTSFLHNQLGMPADDFVKAAAPLVETHPYCQFLATFSIDPRTQRLAWEQVTIRHPEDLESQESTLWREYQTRHPTVAAEIYQAFAERLDATPRDYFESPETDHRGWSAVLLGSSPFSPVGRGVAIEFGGGDYKSRVEEWEKAAAGNPGLAMTLGRLAMDAGRWEEAEKWLKLVTATGDTEAYEKLSKVYELQGKWDQWIAVLEESLEGPDYGLWHAAVHSSMAHYYMHGKQWKKALSHAKEAAESYSCWGLQVLAECREAMNDWSQAEEIYKAMGERYPTQVVYWYDFCRRTGRGDLDAARSEFRKVVGPRRILSSREAVVFYILEKEPANVQTILQHFARDGNPICELHLALLADQAHDKSTRDKILADVKQKAAKYRMTGTRQNYACFGALAGLMADDLAKGGKGEIDLAVAQKLYPPRPFVDEGGCCPGDSRPEVACPYLLGRYLDLHGKPELAVRCWNQCLAQVEFVADFNRTLAAVELRARGIPLDSAEPPPEKDAERPKSEP
jgi:tetratricopeptide (TPR) repeat protein